jgi:hypothetical protein
MTHANKRNFFGKILPVVFFKAIMVFCYFDWMDSPSFSFQNKILTFAQNFQNGFAHRFFVKINQIYEKKRNKI